MFPNKNTYNNIMEVDVNFVTYDNIFGSICVDILILKLGIA